MNDNWYNDGGWYKPLKPHEAAEAPKTDAKNDKSRNRKRRIYLAIFLLVLGLCCIFLAIEKPWVKPASDGFDATQEMPDDFRDYLDSFYSGTTGEPARVDIPKVENRGSLKLNVAGNASGQALSFNEIYEHCTPFVVYIKAWSGSQSSFSWGTGITVSSDGYIITNTHVIEECKHAEVGLTDGSTYEAKLVGADSVSDIALLKIEATGLSAATFAKDVAVGDTVVAIGNPLGERYRLTMTNGIISAKDRSVKHNGTDMNLLQTNAAINEGNSGGPLLNQRGQVVGITNMKVVSALTGVEGIGFAIPTDTVLGIVDAIIGEGAVMGRSTIGITVGVIPDEVSAHYNIPAGLYISHVQKGSDASKQGLKAGDILTEINGAPVSTTQDVADVKNTLEIGDTMHFTVWRNGKTLEFDIALMDATDIYNK